MRETLPLLAHFKAKIAQYGFIHCVYVLPLAFEYNGRARLRVSHLSQHNQRSTRPMCSLPEPEPGCKRNAVCVLGGCGAEIEHQGGKASSL